MCDVQSSQAYIAPLSQSCIFHFDFSYHTIKINNFNHWWRFMRSSYFGCMLSVDIMCLEDRFCASKKSVGWGRWVCIFCAHGSSVLLQNWALVGIDWSISHLLSTNGHRSHFSPLLSPCGATISGSVGIFQSGRAFAGRRALTIERLLMSGYG